MLHDDLPLVDSEFRVSVSPEVAGTILKDLTSMNHADKTMEEMLLLEISPQFRWLCECTEQWTVVLNIANPHVRFRNRNDALLFKLSNSAI